MLDALSSFLAGMLAEYFKDRKISYLVMFVVTAMSIALLFLLYSVASDSFNNTKIPITRTLVATVGMGITCGAVIVIVVKIHRYFLRRGRDRNLG